MKRQTIFRYVVFVASVLFLFLFFSCRSIPAAIPQMIMGTGIMTKEQFIHFFLTQEPSVNRERLNQLVQYYIEESADEGINADIAFAQMCLETGFLRFGGLVTPEMNNFCGLGAINEENRGHSFPDVQTGVRAHIQHLKAYASTEALQRPIVDPRYRYVTPKGKAPAIKDLSGTWAADPVYGHKIRSIIMRMYLSAS